MTLIYGESSIYVYIKVLLKHKYTTELNQAYLLCIYIVPDFFEHKDRVETRKSSTLVKFQLFLSPKGGSSQHGT